VRILTVRPCSFVAGPRHREDDGSSFPGAWPLQSLSLPSCLPTCPPAYDSLWVSGPFNGIPRTSPIVKRAVSPAPVPLAGFLNLSAVSWQIRVSRPCFVPQPFLGSSLQSFPLVKVAYPSRGSLASLQLSTGVL
jgi:hypothetical protein